jgi:CubicO group peptidase (beta-lactamase class C family)
VLSLLVATPALAAPLEPAQPEAVGMSKARLAVLANAINAEVKAGKMPGAVLAIARRGRLAYFESFGFRDPVSKAVMPKDAIFSIASMTKPMVSVAIMMLHDEGKLFLSDPVGKFVPSMANKQLGVIKKGADGKDTVETVAPKRQPTVQDLLSHTSGVTYGARGDTPIHKQWPASSSSSATSMSKDEFVERIGKAPLLHEPGTVWDYSLSTDILGLIVEKASGKPLGEFLAERIWKPLGMTDTSFAVPEAKKARYALAFANDPENGKPQSVLHAAGKPLQFDCGGGCALSSAMDYLRFSQMLLNGGILDGKRLLGRKTVELMTSDHIGPEVRARSSNAVLNPGYNFGLGFAVRNQAGLSQLAGSAGDYNWGGAFGTYFWVDPKEQLAVVWMAATPGEARLRYRTIVKNLVLAAIEN